MDKHVKISDTEIISSQNNNLELARESRRLEKLFYFYRDFNENVNLVEMEEQLIGLRLQNSILIQEVADLVDTKDSKFLKRLGHIWDKFIA